MLKISGLLHSVSIYASVSTQCLRGSLLQSRLSLCLSFEQFFISLSICLRLCLASPSASAVASPSVCVSIFAWHRASDLTPLFSCVSLSLCPSASFSSRFACPFPPASVLQRLLSISYHVYACAFPSVFQPPLPVSLCLLLCQF